MNVMYIHGYGGSAYGGSYELIKNTFDKNNIDANIYAPAIPYLNPYEAVDFIFDFADEYNIDIMIASSLGAFYAMQKLNCADKILINPAMPDNLKAVDIAFYSYHKDDLNGQLSNFENCVNDSEIRATTYVIMGTKDEIANNVDFVKNNFYDENIFYVDMEHNLDEIGAEKICEIVKMLNRGV